MFLNFYCFDNIYWTNDLIYILEVEWHLRLFESSIKSDTVNINIHIMRRHIWNGGNGESSKYYCLKICLRGKLRHAEDCDFLFLEIFWNILHIGEIVRLCNWVNTWPVFKYLKTRTRLKCITRVSLWLTLDNYLLNMMAPMKKLSRDAT